MTKIERIRMLLQMDPRTAVMLTEILSPPVGMRPSGEKDSREV